MDLRIETIFAEQMKGDTSFQEKESILSLLFGSTRYSKHKMRDAWDSGIKHGIEIGLNVASEKYGNSYVFIDHDNLWVKEK